MKHYLDLIPISAKVHRRQNRMTIFCIVLSTILITGIFSMADMFIRSQTLQAIKEGGNWHIAFRDITDEQAKLIALRPDVKYAARYGVCNYRGEEGYTMGGKTVILCGSDEEWLTKMEEGVLEEGSFPVTDTEVLVTQNARKQMELQIGSSVSVSGPDGAQLSFTVAGFVSDSAKTLGDDSYGAFLNTEAMRKWLFPDKSSDHLVDYNSTLNIQFSDPYRIEKSVQEIKEAFGLADGQIIENTKLMGLLGQSGSLLMSSAYSTAGVLSALVMLAGIMMISSSMGSSVAQKIEFYGMVRCIGSTPKQVSRLVRREALRWCRLAIPVGLAIAVGIVWGLCAVLRFLSPEYFGEMPVFVISMPGVVAGTVVGFATVLLAAKAPAKQASRVSPLEAVSGNASKITSVRKAANTKVCKVETALGIHHAVSSKRNLFLMTGSFALSIILFLAFSVTIDFMHSSMPALRPWQPDLSIVSTDNSLSVEGKMLEEIQQNPSVKRAYGRCFAYGVPSTMNGNELSVNLISYEQYQFDWAKDYLIGSGDAIDIVQEQKLTALAVYDPASTVQIQAGDTVSLIVDRGIVDIQIVGVLSQCPFYNVEGVVIICSEDSFRQLVGGDGYTIIDVQLKHDASEMDVEQIQKKAGAGYTFSDRRLSNNSVKGVNYSFTLCVYGFLVMIAFIAICNIINGISLSVSARTRQYGAFCAIGLSRRQLSRMVAAEAFTYAIAGCSVGVILGLLCNKFLFDMLIGQNWGRQWSIPWIELSIILLLVLCSVVIAVREPVKKFRSMSIVDTISAQ